MTSRVKLPEGLVWRKDGHLSDEAVVALADDQDVLPATAVTHADACDSCARRMGEAALLSMVLGARMKGALGEAHGSAAASSQRSAPLPLWAVLFGLGFVGVGAVPFLLGVPSWLPRVVMVLQRSVPVFLHGLVSAGPGVSARALVSLVSLAVLLMSAFAVSRLAPHERVAQ